MCTYPNDKHLKVRKLVSIARLMAKVTNEKGYVLYSKSTCEICRESESTMQEGLDVRYGALYNILNNSGILSDTTNRSS